MYNELYQYLILHRELQLPGIGTFILERKPAEIDFANKQVLSPSYTVALHHSNATGSRKLFQWLASSFRIGESEAVVRVNDFAFEMKNTILAGNRLEWHGIGALSKGLAGEIRFEPAPVKNYSGPLPAIKVLRENAAHVVRVGEQERTSAEMIELLQPSEKRTNWAWVVIVILLISSVIFIGYYFSEHGVSPMSTGNGTRIQPATSGDNHRNIP